MEKLDKTFVSKNGLMLAVECIKNAKELKKESEALMNKGAYSRAFFLAYTGLEESAKAILLIQNSSDMSKINILVDHKMKISEIIKIIESHLRSPFPTKDKEILKKRIGQMREDALYTRLKPTPNDRYCPDNSYWQKRAKAFIVYLDKYLDDLTEKVQKIFKEYKKDEPV
jgi:AbiV family abortive infection protein